ncbi:DUF4317 domain-containing protein [Hespellia stercorisuis]|uniref:DUF4317 domain-containing protein n=1 Tax=Hespellia stercorisuis DSM 15480 TaxID=1121950 RepID=A0A1M6HLH7_9FIRM|nr:DUF4317 domain-containing protein [Hespellia stercorisuis]SHJ23007.1 protein of unknown function [Hespellia stercorisuis DSM 15480]
MNKKETLEIRKQFTPNNCAITRICGCYVDHEKEKKMELKEAFLSLPEEECFKYFDIFKKTLGGTIGKNLMNMEFPLAQESAGGTQKFLLDLRDSKLKDEMLLEEFYDKVIENYDYAENYYIILIHANYDVPGRSSDGLELFDASDSVYEFVLCSICPVNLTKAGLSYNGEKNSIEERIRDWVVDVPVNGFLFPLFNDRSSDIHGVLYYSKKPEELQPAFIENVLGSVTPLTAAGQKETFNAIIADTLGEDCHYDVVKNIHETIQEMVEEHKDEPEPLELSKTDVKKVFEKSGVPQERMEVFEKEYEEIAGEKTELLAANIVDTKKFSIETPDIVIKVNPDRADLVETRLIDGRQCLVIAVDDHIEVNGITVKTLHGEEII